MEIPHKIKTIFIINPKSGISRKANLPEIIETVIDKNKFDYKIEYTQYAKHAITITKQAIAEGYELVVIAGGDGSINEVASVLQHTSVKLGVIPLGSGNGLARHLNIPLDAKAAAARINLFNSVCVDSASIGDQPFFCACGIGFDGYIAHLFNTTKKRGISKYVWLSAKNFFTYKYPKINYLVDGKSFNEEVLMIAVANAKQFGGNFQIAPNANLNDGVLHCVVVKKFPWWLGASLVFKGFMGTLTSGKYVSIIDCKNVEFQINQLSYLHFDGEPFTSDKPLTISVVPQSLQVVC